MRRGEAIFTALEHEAMHQETLLYMWHRLPHEQKRAPARAALRASAATPPPARDRRRFRPARRRSAPIATRDPVRLGQRVRRASRRRRRRSRSTCTTSPTRTSSSSSRPAAIARREWWSDAGWEWREHERRRASGVLGARRRASGCWRGMFENIPLPPRGRCTSARRKRRRSRAGGAAGCRPRPSIIAPPSARRRGGGQSSAHPWGERRPDASARQLRLRVLGAGPGRRASARARAPGACTTSSATAGSGRRRSSARSPASSRWRRIPSTRPTSSTASTT